MSTPPSPMSPKILRQDFNRVLCEYRVSQKNFWYKLKTTAFTRSAFMFSKSSYSNLNFGIKQSKIGWKFAEQWLPKVKISEPVDDRRPDFFEGQSRERSRFSQVNLESGHVLCSSRCS